MGFGILGGGKLEGGPKIRGINPQTIFFFASLQVGSQFRERRAFVDGDGRPAALQGALPPGAVARHPRQRHPGRQPAPPRHGPGRSLPANEPHRAECAPQQQPSGEPRFVRNDRSKVAPAIAPKPIAIATAVQEKR